MIERSSAHSGISKAHQAAGAPRRPGRRPLWLAAVGTLCLASALLLMAGDVRPYLGVEIQKNGQTVELWRGWPAAETPASSATVVDSSDAYCFVTIERDDLKERHLGATNNEHMVWGDFRSIVEHLVAGEKYFGQLPNGKGVKSLNCRFAPERPLFDQTVLFATAEANYANNVNTIVLDSAIRFAPTSAVAIGNWSAKVVDTPSDLSYPPEIAGKIRAAGDYGPVVIDASRVTGPVFTCAAPAPLVYLRNLTIQTAGIDAAALRAAAPCVRDGGRLLVCPNGVDKQACVVQ